MTAITRNMRGELHAKTRIALTFHGVAAVLEIETSKSDKSVSARASVSWPTACGRGFIHRFSFGGDGDYSEVRAKKPARATEKAIREVHELAMSKQDEIIANAKAYYAKPESVYRG